MNTPSPETGTGTLSRRERLALLLELNSEYMAYQAEDLLERIGWAGATPMLVLVKRLTRGAITRKNLGDLPRWTVATMLTDDQFDELYRQVMQWLTEI